jgi:hypothetical protein
MNMTDMETCYKVFRREILQSIPIEEDRFGFEPEITVKIAKRRLRVYEVGISYWGEPTKKEENRLERRHPRPLVPGEIHPQLSSDRTFRTHCRGGLFRRGIECPITGIM